MQNHLAAAANQVTVNYRDVRCLKDKVVIQKVQTLPRTKDLYQNPGIQGGKAFAGQVALLLAFVWQICDDFG